MKEKEKPSFANFVMPVFQKNKKERSTAKMIININFHAKTIIADSCLFLSVILLIMPLRTTRRLKRKYGPVINVTMKDTTGLVIR